jgi:hypothetical protein
MTFSLYAAIVPPFVQVLGSVTRLLDKAESFCAENELAPEEIIQARIAPDMLPFTYQVKSTVEHSIGAIRAAKAGRASPSLEPPPADFASLRAKLSGAIAALNALDRSELDLLIAQPVRFEFKTTRIDFTGADFLTAYAQPNFYFHATTAYDILRMRGVQIGKTDFLGRLPAQPSSAA